MNVGMGNSQEQPEVPVPFGAGGGMNNSYRRLVIVSNRLPFTAVESDAGLTFEDSSGGMVSGLRGYLDQLGSRGNHLREYIWIGWPGNTISEARKEELKSKALLDFHSHPVFLTQEEMNAFYFGFCNRTIWPLFHYFPSFAQFSEESWQQYRRINQMFCDAVAEVATANDIIWVHDYHLMLLPNLLQARNISLPVGFFLHIPFPSFEMFRLLPGRWRREILRGILGADMIGFHTYDYTQHFLQSVLRILGYEHRMGQISAPDRIVKAETFPMGIDYARFRDGFADPDVQRERTELSALASGRKIVLSLDRLDYTKGIINRLLGFERLLELNQRFREKVVLLMVVVPSRIGVDQYDQMKKQIEELVGKINGKFGSMQWTPIVYQYRSVPFGSLMALYGISDVSLVTPLRDGMNLVAKEYIAACGDRTGVLILSEMAGAAKELGEAIIINPNNVEEIADALGEALDMSLEEQKRRNGIMQKRLKRYNVSRWANDFVQELLSMVTMQRRYYAKLLTHQVTQKLLDDYRLAERRLILLDYDGTLVPFVRHPLLAAPTPEVMQLLKALSSDPHNTCVLISGRDREILGNWFGRLPLEMVAEHGVWIKEHNEPWRMPKESTNSWKERIVPILDLYADRLPGAFVEDKEYSVAFHYRSADPEQGRTLVGELMDHLVSFTANEDIQVLHGHKVVEVRNAGVNKGSAALPWLQRGSFDFQLAIGDDASDEELFGVLPQSAYSVRVGIVNTHARFNVRGPSEVLALLQKLTDSAKPAVREGAAAKTPAAAG